MVPVGRGPLMPTGLVALLDDIVGITKLAAASLDDVTAAAGKAGSKAMGVVVDDAAVTPRYVTDFHPDRELPIIWRIAKGSLRNKIIILLPAALMTALWFVWRDRSPRLAAVWLGGIVVATLITTASKVAFLGYGLGWAALDFTGVSGHSMFAAAIYPLTGVAIICAIAGLQAARWERLGLAAGVALALVVGLSRVAVDAHSWSEVVVGLLVGGAVTLVAARAERAPPARHSLWLPVVIFVWLGSASPNAPPSLTHGWVTRLALAVSGRAEPYTRADLLSPHVAPADSSR